MILSPLTRLRQDIQNVMRMDIGHGTQQSFCRLRVSRLPSWTG